MNRLKKLGDFLDIKRGASLSGEFYAEDGNLIRLTLGNFNYPGGGFKENTSKEDIYFTGNVRNDFILKKGDIITPLTEQVNGLLGETATIPEDNIYIQSGDIGLLKPKDNLNDRFAYYLLQSNLVRKQLSAGAQQTKIRHTSPDKIKDCLVYVPVMKTQKKIGIILDSINNKIVNNNNIISKLESLVKTIYDYWFLQFEFPNEEGKPYKSSGGKMVWNEELKREIPEEWRVGYLDDLGTIVAGGTPSTKNNNYYCKTGIAWLTPYDLSNTSNKYINRGERDISEEGLKHSSATLIPKGSVLLTSRAPIGYIGIAANELCTNQGFKSIIPKESYGSEFTYYTVKSIIPYIQRLGSGSTFKEVSKETMQGIKVVLPNLNIVTKYNQKMKTIVSKRKLAEKENSLLIELRNFLLPLLMNGQVGFKDVE